MTPTMKIKILAFVLLLIALRFFVAPDTFAQGTIPTPPPVYLPLVENAVPLPTTAPTRTPTQTPTPRPDDPTPTATATLIPGQEGEVVVLSSTVFKPEGTKDYDDIIVEVANQTNYVVDGVEITINLIDIQNRIVATESESIRLRLLPGVIAATTVRFLDAPTYETYQIVDITWASSVLVPFELKLSDLETSFDEGVFRLTGTVTNQSSTTRTNITVLTLMYDANNKVIGVGYNAVFPRSLEPGAKATFEFFIVNWAGKPDTSLVKRFTARAWDND